MRADTKKAPNGAFCLMQKDVAEWTGPEIERRNGPADPAEKENPADRTINGIEFWRSGRDSNPRPST